MNKVGIVAILDKENNKASVVFNDMNHSSTFLLPIADHITELQIGDNVLVTFTTNNIDDGIITSSLAGRISVNPPRDSCYIHNQIMPSATWIINHNLESFPSVTIVDSGGSVVIGEIQYINENQIKVSFTVEFSGKAYLN